MPTKGRQSKSPFTNWTAKKAPRQKKSKSSVLPPKAGVKLTPSRLETFKGTGIPDRLRANIQFSSIGGFTTPAGGVTGILSFRLNGAQDPEVAFGGGQPNYWDTLALLYRNYRVIGATVKLELIAPALTGYFFGYRIRPATETSSTGLTYAQFKSLPNTVLKYVTTTGKQQIVNKINVKPWGVLGMSEKEYMSTPNTVAAVNTTPTTELYIDIVCYTPNFIAISSILDVAINYKVEFDSLKLIYDV